MFIVKHYGSNERPIIKGHGFDGLEIGEDRQEAQEFIDFVNKLIEAAHNRDYAKCKIDAEIKRLEENPDGDYTTRISALEWVLRIIAEQPETKTLPLVAG